MGKIRRLFLITAVVFAGFLVFSNTAQACQILDVFWGDESGVGNPARPARPVESSALIQVVDGLDPNGE